MTSIHERGALSSGDYGWLILAAGGVVGGLMRLIAGDAIRRQWPRLHDWLTGYQGLALRWAVLAAGMLGVALFVVVMAAGTTQQANRNFLWAFAALITAIAVFFAEQARRGLRQATLEGRRRRRK
ncbi:MAG: hypothetical protein ACTHOK_19595 [Nocardioidaceae bacterium]